MATRDLAEQVKVGLAAAAVVATGAGFVMARLRRRAADNEAAREFLQRTPLLSIGRFGFNAAQVFFAALTLLALLGTLNYNQYSSRVALKSYDNYDLLHYYVSAKYFDELGYFNLLPALIVADDERGAWCEGQVSRYMAQDENDYSRQPLRHALDQRTDIKARFTPERWRQFVHDVTFLQRKNTLLNCKLWRELLIDHGFNGTPTWVLIARPIAGAIPVEWMKFATALDFIWLAAMLVAIWWAFGRETFAFSWIFIMVCYSFRWPMITWAFLRYDWLASMVIGICLVRRERPVAGGAFLAYATLMRYFPVLWLFGIFAKGLHALINRTDIPFSRAWRRVPSSSWKMAAGFFATAALLLALSIARDGAEAHRASLHNISAHVEPHNLSSRREGLVIALVYRGETEMKLISDEKKRMVEDIEPAVRLGALLAMIALGLFLSRSRDFEAMGYGVIPYFWLTTSSYYYYSLRLTAVVIHAADLSKRRNVIGLTLLFLIELFANASEHLKPGNRYFLVGVMGVLLAIYTLMMFGSLGLEWWRSHRAGEPAEYERPAQGDSI
jgi:hypothetical protein